MDDICLNQPEDGMGIESCLDVDTAIMEAIRTAWERADPTSTITIRSESSVVEAVITTDEQLNVIVLRTDGTVTKHPRWSEA